MVEIFLPTARWDPWVRGLLHHLDWITREFPILVSVSDNSQNADKQRLLAGLSDGNPRFRAIIQPRRLGAVENLDVLLQSGSCGYGVLLGDDDWIFPDYVLGADQLLERNPDVAAVMGCLVHIAPGIAASVHPPIEILDEDPASRIRTYLARNDGYNHPVLSVFKSSAILPFRAFIRAHPLIASFFDYLQTFSFLGTGKIVSRPARGPYLYINANWSTPDLVRQSNARSYIALGLPEWFADFHSLYRAVEGFAFLSSRVSPIVESSLREPAAVSVMEHYLRIFRVQLQHMSTGWWQGARGLGIEGFLKAFVESDQMAIADVTNRFLAILSVGSADLHRRYIDFHQQLSRGT